MYKFRTTPFDYQERAFHKAKNMESCGLFIAPGGGKTKVAIDCCGYWNVNHNYQKVLIITPKSVIGVWEEEIDLHIGYGVGFYEVVRLTKKTSKQDVKNYKKVDCLTFMIATPDRVCLIADTLQSWKPDIVIMDEGHYIKRWNAKRTRMVKRIGKVASRRLLLTGTPMTKNYLDLWSQLDFLEDGILGNWAPWRDRIAIWGGYMLSQIMGWDEREVKKLKNLVKQKAVVIGKDKLNLPPLRYRRIPIYLEGSLKYYNEMVRHSLIEMEGIEVTAEIVLTQMQKLQEITGGFLKDDEGNIKYLAQEKLEVLQELVEKYVFELDEKLVIFARFKPEMKMIEEMCHKIFSKKKLEVGVIKGGVSDKRRDDYRNRFQDRNSNLKVLICQLGAGGIGITLHAAKTAIFYSMDFQLDHYIQCRDRVHRKGQKDDTEILFLICKDTVDEDVVKRNVQKLGFSDVMFGWKDILKEVVS